MLVWDKAQYLCRTFSASAGLHTYKGAFNCTNGSFTTTVGGGAGDPAFISIELV